MFKCSNISSNRHASILPSHYLYRLQTPRASSNLSLPISASPFCKADNANFVSSMASATCALESVLVVVVVVDDDLLKDDAMDEKIPLVVVDDDVVRGAVATGEGDRGFDFDADSLSLLTEQSGCDIVVADVGCDAAELIFPSVAFPASKSSAEGDAGAASPSRLTSNPPTMPILSGECAVVVNFELIPSSIP